MWSETARQGSYILCKLHLTYKQHEKTEAGEVCRGEGDGEGGSPVVKLVKGKREQVVEGEEQEEVGEEEEVGDEEEGEEQEEEVGDEEEGEEQEEVGEKEEVVGEA